MKAAYFMKNGGPEVMEYGDVPDPVAGRGEVLVDIHAASVNAADWKTRSGYRAPTTRFPYIPGRDFSGIVSFALQLAKHIGAHVITTTSAANRDYVRSLGADEIIDYNAQDFTKVVSGCDAVVDTVGGDVALRSFAVLRPGGRAAFISGSAPAAQRDDVTAIKPKVERDRAHLERIVDLVTSGAVRVPEISVYSLSQAAAAHTVSEGRHFRGKLVFRVR